MAVLVLMFIVVPIAELYVIVQTSHAIGFFNTLGLLLAVSLVGGWLVKHQGLRVWNRFHQQVQRGVVPSKEIADGVLILVAGALLLVPGFITDALGILLLLPPVRALVRKVLMRRMRHRAEHITATYGGRLGPGHIIDVDGRGWGPDRGGEAAGGRPSAGQGPRSDGGGRGWGPDRGGEAADE